MVEWEPKIPCTLRYTTKPGSRLLENYSNTFVARGGGELLLNPAKEGLPTGIYYCMLVSDGDSTVTSVEFIVIVQANAVPNTLSPQNGALDLSQGVPLFEWEAVERVPYYFLFLSEGPLSIERDERGEVSGLTGLNLTWQAITPSTFLRYGDSDPSGSFQNAHVPPLFEGVEYNWIVLNAYASSPDFIAGNVAPIQPSFFKVDRPFELQAPDLISPAADAVIVDDEIIFEWSPVPEVSRYRIFLFEKGEFIGNEVDFTMWSQITTNTQVTLRAKDFLVKSTYHWRVVGENANGISQSASLSRLDALGVYPTFEREPARSSKKCRDHV